MRKELGVVLAGRICLSALSLIYIKLLLTVLNGHEFGLYTFIFATASWLNLLLFGAINIPLTNYSANYGDQPRTVNVFQSLVAYSAGPVIVFISFVSSSIYFFSSDIYENQFWLFGILTGLFATAIGTATMTSGFAMGQRRRIYNLLINNSIMLSRIVIVLIAITLGVSFTKLILGITLINLLVAAIAVFWLTATFKIVKFSEVKKDLSDNRLITEYKENWLVNAGSNILLYGDKVLLAFVLPLEVLGLLAIYQQICRVISNMTIGTFYQFISPYILKKSNQLSTRIFMFTNLLVTFGAFAPMVVLVWLLGPWINLYLLDGVYRFEFLPFLLVALTIAFTQTSKTNELLFFSKGIISYLKRPLIISLCTFLIIGLPLAYKFGLMGAIYGLLIASIIRYLFTLLVLVQHSDIQLRDEV